ncbi:MAG: DUF4062 domain-containing protein [Candidatus Methanoperedens sp.]|nr:DUF4062 domain-containing protein [Candidatus Methanoperedens sp.]MCZ7370058.1 DUF4062 domain-containing protein [Candidatus Methanoperedens sp.]
MIQKRKKPQVFISSTINELKDERLIVKESLNQFGFEPAMFEEWGARSSGLRQTYIDEVMNSDLYVGIFDKKYSGPTIEEYETARAHNIDTIIYIKKFNLGRREKKLQSFIESISDPDEGHVLCYFDDIMDLRAKLKNDLSWWIARIVVCKTSNKSKEDRYTELEMKLALDSLIANKIIIVTDDICRLTKDFLNEILENLRIDMDMTKTPFNSVNVKTCLIKAMIISLLKRMKKIDQTVLHFYVNIVSIILSGGSFSDLIADIENKIKDNVGG